MAEQEAELEKQRLPEGSANSLPKLCQKLLRRPPTLVDAPDVEIQHFRRWPTLTDARNWLSKQARYRVTPRSSGTNIRMRSATIFPTPASA